MKNAFGKLLEGIMESTGEMVKNIVEIGSDTVDEIVNHPGRFLAETVDEFSGLSYVKPVKGSVVYCNLLGGVAEHSGIYVGDGKIVHMNGDGLVEAISPESFLSRMDGMNTAYLIYVSCDGCNSVGRKKIAMRALKAVGEWQSYNMLFNNCHRFTSGCVTGDFANTDNQLWRLKQTCADKLSATDWHPWRHYK